MKNAASTRLQRAIHIITSTICTAGLRLAQLHAVDLLLVIDIGTSETQPSVDHKFRYVRFQTSYLSSVTCG
jgi:hypothetical protein